VFTIWGGGVGGCFSNRERGLYTYTMAMVMKWIKTRSGTNCSLATKTLSWQTFIRKPNRPLQKVHTRSKPFFGNQNMLFVFRCGWMSIESIPSIKSIMPYGSNYLLRKHLGYDVDQQDYKFKITQNNVGLSEKRVTHSIHWFICNVPNQYS